VVPPELSAVFDMRVTRGWDLQATEKLLNEICAEAGPGVRTHFIQQQKITESTSTGPENVWWTTFTKVAEKL